MPRWELPSNCLDLPPHPDEDFLKVQKYVAGFSKSPKGGPRLEYTSCDVTQQQKMQKVVENIARRERHIDVCVCNAGVLHAADVLEYPAKEWQKGCSVCGVERWRRLPSTFSLTRFATNGVFFTAQAAGREMVKQKTGGSIIPVASISGHYTNQVRFPLFTDSDGQGMQWTAYNTSKAAVMQMTRSLACELGPKGIRVNSISPGYVFTGCVTLVY